MSKGWACQGRIHEERMSIQDVKRYFLAMKQILLYKSRLFSFPTSLNQECKVHVWLSKIYLLLRPDPRESRWEWFTSTLQRQNWPLWVGWDGPSQAGQKLSGHAGSTQSQSTGHPALIWSNQINSSCGRQRGPCSKGTWGQGEGTCLRIEETGDISLLRQRLHMKADLCTQER